MRILLSGATGAMGKTLAEVVKTHPEASIIAGWADEQAEASFPIVTDLAQLDAQTIGQIDVIIDFSSHATAPVLAAFASEHQLPMVIATTGHTEAEKQALTQASASLPVFISGNTSLGVYVQRQLASLAAKLLPGFDIEIIEAHHRRKTDAPSGTAKLLADAVSAQRPELVAVGGREGDTGARKSQELGIHAVRGGTIVGEHTVMFAGEDEVIRIVHSAQSKQVFAHGAIRAAAAIINKLPGLYTMDDIV